MSEHRTTVRRPTPRARASLLALVLLVAGLLVPAVPARAASGFVDVPVGSPFHAEVTWLAEQGISTGWPRPDGSREFRPYAPVNRDAMAAFLYRLAGSPAVSLPAQSPFADMTPATQHYVPVVWAAQRGITTGWGRPDGAREFRPTQPIDRDAMAAFLHRFAGAPAYSAPAATQFWDVRPDLPFHSEIHWLRDRGITTGWPGAFGCPGYRPWAPIARNAMAAFLYRYVNGGVPQPANTCDDPRLGQDWETLPTTSRVVAITFDGGWSATATDRILATLEREDVPATFFFTGAFVRRNPAVTKAVADAGPRDGQPLRDAPQLLGAGVRRHPLGRACR